MGGGEQPPPEALMSNDVEAALDEWLDEDEDAEMWSDDELYIDDPPSVQQQRVDLWSDDDDQAPFGSLTAHITEQGIATRAYDAPPQSRLTLLAQMVRQNVGTGQAELAGLPLPDSALDLAIVENDAELEAQFQLYLAGQKAAMSGNTSTNSSKRAASPAQPTADSSFNRNSTVTEASHAATASALGSTQAALKLDLSNVRQSCASHVSDFQAHEPQLNVQTPKENPLPGSPLPDSDWEVAASLYHTNRVLMQLPRECQESIKKKIETIGKMLRSDTQLEHPVPGVVKQIATWSSQGSESLMELSDAASGQSVQCAEGLDQVQVPPEVLDAHGVTLSHFEGLKSTFERRGHDSFRGIERGPCLRCSKPVLATEHRIKCANGYFHHSCGPNSARTNTNGLNSARTNTNGLNSARSNTNGLNSARSNTNGLSSARSTRPDHCLHCSLPLLPSQQIVQHTRGLLHRCCVDYFNPVSARRVHQTRKSEQGLFKGECAHCHLPVFATDRRSKCEAGYLHHQCLAHFKLDPGQLAILKAQEAVRITAAARSMQL